MVVHAHRVELDRDAALALQVHRVEDLLPHQTLVERARELDEAVGQGRLAVVDVGHDTEVADVILAHVGLKYSHPPSIIRRGPTLADDGCERTRYTPRGLLLAPIRKRRATTDRKSTRLKSSHSQISYAVFCL